MNLRTLIASLALGSLSTFSALTQAATPLQLEVYNPGSQGIFPVTSTLISGKRDMILVDAQFQRQDAQALVDKIKASGKRLKAIYVSQADPDFYFGLGLLHAAFPDTPILATPQTIAIIRAQMDGKLAYWGPILKDQAPTSLVLPTPLQGNTLHLEGQPLRIMSLDGAAPERSYLWIPALRTVAGGVVVSSGEHVWMADTQTPAARQAWLASLREIEALKPRRVIPGHYLGPVPQGLEAVRFTADYIKRFETEAAQAADAQALNQAMQRAYPAFAPGAGLEISSKVIKGEMKWPQ
jgi:glyoxylase-like metal-dependent hydrolase (beta-lactamase superfamily II)